VPEPQGNACGKRAVGSRPIGAPRNGDGDDSGNGPPAQTGETTPQVFPQHRIFVE